MTRWAEVARIERQNGARSCRVVNAKGERDKGCTGRFEESHHGIFAGQRSGRATAEWRMFLDSVYNHCPACHSCNVSRVGDPAEARLHFFQRQVNRYGAAQMSTWLKTAPAEIKERHEFKRYLAMVTERTAV